MNNWKKITLNGQWKMIFLRDSEVRILEQPIVDYHDFINSNKKIYNAVVPGSFELDLYHSHDIEDPYFGLNVLKMQEYEDCHVYYYREFEYEDVSNESPQLVFEGLDTITEIYLNGELLKTTDNMLIEHTAWISGIKSGTNCLLIHIIPACVAAREYEIAPGHLSLKYNYEMLRIRKAPHMFGWDICPRIVSAGIWKPVYLQYVPMDHIIDTYVMTYEENGEGNKATIDVFFSFKIQEGLLQDYKIKITGSCKDSKFEYNERLWFTSGVRRIDIPDARLWWPKGRGEQNLYDITVEITKNDRTIDIKHVKAGIRAVKLIRTGITDVKRQGKFEFIINKEKIFVLGTNWVPVDAFHSNDVNRIEQILKLVDDIGCNAIRCWGGNVYEDELFYSTCDQLGIMVWQDFALACAVYPQDNQMSEKIREETVSVVKRLRQHPSIVIWAGDNECDLLMSRAIGDRDPNINRLTRTVIKDVVDFEDPTRPYLPSSPYYDEDAYREGRIYITENHLWGPRDYYKSNFYTTSLCHFVSEIGYHGCPSVESIKKFISPEKLWPWQENEEWIVHAANPETSMKGVYAYRVELMAKQIKELFGYVPENLDDFVLASQISQAEAKKFFIELFRQEKWVRTGIIWWNIMDCWPQFSDAVVDYYFDKKLAYDYIKRSQSPFCIVFSEPSNWNIKILALNDTKQDIDFEFEVIDATGDNCVVMKSNATIKPDSVLELDSLKYSQGEKKFYVIKWKSSLGDGFNHYLAGNPPFELKEYIGLAKQHGLIN